MSPYNAKAAVVEDLAKMENTLRIRLDPIQAEVKFPVPFYREGDDPLRQKIELSRQLLANTRKVATLALYKAVAGKDAPPYFDWEAMDRDEFAETRKERDHYKKYADALAQRLERLVDAMEAMGYNAAPIVDRVPLPGEW